MENGMNGVITKIRLFYMVAMTYDFRLVRILRKRDAKLYDKVSLYKGDILRFKLFTAFMVIALLTLNTGIIYGVMNYSSPASNKMYVFLDMDNSYKLEVSDKMKVNSLQVYKNKAYKNYKGYSNSDLVTTAEKIIEKEMTDKVVAITYVQENEQDSNQLRQINKELDKINMWVNENYSGEYKAILLKGKYSDMKYAIDKRLPIGKYLILKNCTYAKKTVKENDLYTINLHNMLELNDTKVASVSTDVPIMNSTETPTSNKTPVITKATAKNKTNTKAKTTPTRTPAKSSKTTSTPVKRTTSTVKANTATPVIVEPTVTTVAPTYTPMPTPEITATPSATPSATIKIEIITPDFVIK